MDNIERIRTWLGRLSAVSQLDSVGRMGVTGGNLTVADVAGLLAERDRLAACVDEVRQAAAEMCIYAETNCYWGGVRSAGDEIAGILSRHDGSDDG